MLARLGGDEFAVIAARPDRPGARPAASPRASSTRSAATTSGAAMAALISTSIGIAIYPDDALDRASAAEPRRHRALSRQDRRPRHLPLLRGRDGRRGARPPACSSTTCATPFRAASCASSTSRRSDIQTGEVVGFEALLRWKHPTRGDDLAGRLHPDRRGERADPADRRVGAAHGLPRGGDLDAAARSSRSTSRRCSSTTPNFAAARARDPARRPGLPPRGWSSRSPRPR